MRLVRHLSDLPFEQLSQAALLRLVLSMAFILGTSSSCGG